MPEFRQFNLVGGTSLSLQIGHRISIDLDLFTFDDFDSSSLAESLQTMGDLEIIIDKPPFFQTKLNQVKLDFLKFGYPFVRQFQEIEGVRLVSVETIAVMKLMAIARRGAKKDFFDLYFILEIYSVAQVVEFFRAHLPHVDLFHVLKSLTYFEEAEVDANPKMLKKVTWQQVKKTILQKVGAYLSQK